MRFSKFSEALVAGACFAFALSVLCAMLIVVLSAQPKA